MAFQDLQSPPQILNQLNQLSKLVPLGLDDESVDEASIHLSARTFLYHKFKEFFIENIPVELVKQLPACCK